MHFEMMDPVDRISIGQCRRLWKGHPRALSVLPAAAPPSCSPYTNLSDAFAHCWEQDAVTVQVCQGVHATIQSLVGLVFLMVLSWKLSLIGLAIAPVIALLMLVQVSTPKSETRNPTPETQPRPSG